MVVRALRILAILWVVGITARYLDTIQKSLHYTINEGSDLISVGVLLAFAALFAGSLALKSSAGFRFWAGALMLMALTILVLSGSLVPALIALWMVIAATLLGDRLLAKIGLVSRDNLCDRFVIGFSIGIAVLGTVALALALAALFNSVILWIVLLAVTALELPRLPTLSRELKSRALTAEKFFAAVPEARFLILLGAFAIVRNLTWAVAPEVEFDTNNMRLTVPRIFLEEGRFVDLPYIWHSYFVHLLEYFHGFCMALESEAVAKLVVAVIGCAAALSVYSLGRLLFSPSAGLWAAVFFYTTPLVSWGAGTAYNDNAVAQFLTSSMVAGVLWYRTRQTSWIIVSGFLSGAAIAIKLNAAYAVLPLAIALTVAAFGGATSSRPLRAVASFAVPVMLMAAPWYVVVYILTGNPIFPLMNGIFKSPFWDLDNRLMNAADFGVGTSPAALLRLPFRITLQTTLFSEALPRGSLGPLLLVALPFGFLRLRENRAARIVAFVVCIYLALWAFTFQYARYYTAVLPGIAILGIGGFLQLAESSAPRFKRFMLGALLVAQMALLPALYWRIPERFPIRFALGLESRDSFLRRSLSGYGAVQYVNSRVQPGEKVLAIGFEEVRFYLKPPLETYAESRKGSVLRDSLNMEPGKALANLLLDAHLTYILVSPEEVSLPQQPYPYARPEFLMEFATMEYADRHARVYRLKQ